MQVSGPVEVLLVPLLPLELFYGLEPQQDQPQGLDDVETLYLSSLIDTVFPRTDNSADL
jgi:hypothetical protein